MANFFSNLFGTSKPATTTSTGTSVPQSQLPTSGFGIYVPKLPTQPTTTTNIPGVNIKLPTQPIATPKITPVINASQLGASTTKYVPPPVNNTAQNNLSNIANDTIANRQVIDEQTALDQQNQFKSTTADNRQSILDKLMGNYDKLGTKGARTLEVQEQEGIFEKKKQLTEIENQIRSKSRAYELESRKIQENKEGTFGGAMQQNLSDLDRKRSSELADLAIVEQSIRGNYNDAIAIAQAKIDAEFEPLATQIEGLKTYYQMNQNDLSESEKIQLTAQINQQEAAANSIMTAKKNAYAMAVQNGAPASVIAAIGQAKDEQSIYGALGSYGVDQLEKQYKQAQIDNIRSTISDRGSSDGVTISGKPQTATQLTANGYADRLAEADVVINTLGKDFTGKLAFGGMLPNVLQGADRQAYEQSKRNFITAILRRESGAAISPTEFDTAEKQYFPQAGDQAKTLAQKETSRNTAINNFYREAGVLRPVLPNQIIESDGKKYKVGLDGETLTEIK